MALSTVINTIEEHGGRALLVGGCVRDFILYNKPIVESDIDIATTLHPDTIAKIFAEKSKVITQYATNIVYFDGFKFEITTTRRDVKCDGRHAIMEYSDSFEEDAQRRDFTINALYMDVKTGKIYDFVNGMEDLRSRVVRFIGDPHQRIKEDYLRILRFFRFSALYSDSIDQNGLLSCRDESDGIAKLSGERIRQEMLRIIGSSKAMDIIRVMQENGIISGYDLSKNIQDIDDNFLRFALLTRCILRNDFVYTKKEKSLIELYHRTLDASQAELFYTVSPDIFMQLCVLRGLDAKSFPLLPITRLDIVNMGIKDISGAYKKCIKDFIASNFSLSKEGLKKVFDLDPDI